jgi:hypothetical protein
MKWTTLRLLGALFALTLVAAACGSDTTDTATAAAETEADDAMDDNDMDDDAMDAMDDEHDDHEMEDEHEHDDHETDDEHDHASMIDVDTTLPIPEVAITLTPTETAGEFDLRVIIANFTITPENVDGDPVDNEGHMHLLMDGEKVDRFYDLERTISVPEGEHLVEVELNANNHAVYAVDGAPIRTGMTVEGAGEAAMEDDAMDAMDAMEDEEHDQDDDHDHDHDGELVGAIEGDLTVDDADVTIMATYTGGQISGVENRTSVPLGSVVAITVIADVDEAVHLHGYDILDDVPASDLGLIIFTADTPGRFELELENSGTFITELEVS